MLIKQLRKKINFFDSIFFMDEASPGSLDLNLNLILLVGMADSPHFIKWLTILEQEFPEREIIIYPSDRPRFSHKYTALYKKNRNQKMKVFKIVPNNKLNFAIYFFLDKVLVFP